MRLPGLPTTKASILSRASKEGWRYEEQYGIGGIRKLFEIPEAYLSKEKVSGLGLLSACEDIERYFAAHSANEGERNMVVDETRLTIAARVMEEWLAKRPILIDPKRKAAIIAILYKIIVSGGEAPDLVRLLNAITEDDSSDIPSND